MGNCYGGSTVPGNYGYGGAGVPYAAGYGGVDVDPITPGIQSTPGVVTPTGPPQIVGGPGVGAIGTPGIGINTAPIGIGSPTIGIPPMGIPPTGIPPVGFQQTNFQTSPIVQGGFRPPIPGSVGGFGTTFPGAGISRPGFGIGTPGVGIGGPFVPQANFGGLRGGIDMDPISPGIQTRPGVVTATGPTIRI
jgi:hypothetical protein